MFNSAIIEVAIGMVFIFSLLSILVTQVNTLIINFMNLRARQLKEGLIHMVSDREMQAKILAHPLIRMVPNTVNPEESISKQRSRDIVNMKETRVGYIAPSTFVEALMSLLTSDADSTIFKPLEDSIAALPNTDHKVRLREMLRDLRSFGTTDTRQMRAAILELPNETHKQVLSYALEAVEDSFGRLPMRTGQMMPLLEGIRQIKDPAFQNAIKTVLITAEDIRDARRKLENWFDDGMARVSELYKRRLQYLSLGVGLVVALLLNADALQLANTFWEDPALRQTVADTARRNISQVERDLRQTEATTPNAQQATPVPEINPETEAASEEQRAESEVAARAAVEQSAQQVNNTVQQLLDLQIPLGWEFTPITDELIATSQLAGLPDPRTNLRNLWNLLPTGNPDWFNNFIRKVVGIAVMMVAIAQGAPFWFDLLRRITSGGRSTTTIAPSPTVNVNLGRETEQSTLPPQYG
jgi:hypothetical protein